MSIGRRRMSAVLCHWTRYVVAIFVKSVRCMSRRCGMSERGVRRRAGRGRSGADKEWACSGLGIDGRVGE